MHCGNCGHDERVHNETTERCCAPDCRCSMFENWSVSASFVDEEIEGTVSLGGMFVLDKEDVEELISRMGFVQCETDTPPALSKPMKIPDTIRASDLDLDNQETRRWLAEKIRSEN